MCRGWSNNQGDEWRQIIQVAWKHNVLPNLDELIVDSVKKMEAKLRTAMRQAMHDKLIEACEATPMKADDVIWVQRLVQELVERLNALTPSRVDLHAKLRTSIDVDLVGQMLTHESVEPADVRHMVTALFERAAQLCAPLQDAKVTASRDTILMETNIPKCVATLVFELNDIVTEIEELLAKAHTAMAHATPHSSEKR